MKADAMADLWARIMRMKEGPMSDAVVAASLKTEGWDAHAVDRLMRDPGLTEPT